MTRRLSPWPFKKCASPDAFLTALRKAIPHRFATWETTWWIDSHANQLVFTIAAPYVSAGGPDRNGIGVGDILKSDPWYRRHAANARLRRFAGIPYLHLGGGGSHALGHQDTFRLDLLHLPIVQRAVAEHAALQAGLNDYISGDAALKEMHARRDTLGAAIRNRAEEARAEYHAAHAEIMSRLAAAGLADATRIA